MTQEQLDFMIKHDPVSFETYMKLQVEEALKFKWVESERAGFDLGEKALKAWVENFADEFREHYVYEGKHPVIPPQQFCYG